MSRLASIAASALARVLPAAVAVGVAIRSGGAAAEPATYTVDATHTIVTFEADHLALSTLRGRLVATEGAVTLDRQAGSGRVEVAFAADTVDTGVAALDEALRGPAFLDAGTHPVLRFAADAVRFDGDRVAAVRGALTMRGRTLPLTLHAASFGCYTNPLLRREVCGGDFEAELEPARWGLASGASLGLGERVRLRVQVEGIRS